MFLFTDEGAESGDDSEEDMVTSYLGNPPSAPPHHHPPLPPQRHIQQSHYQVQPAHTHGPPRRLMRMAEIPTMDSMTAEALGGAPPPPDAFIPPIPTISITPHSPITHKPFTVLGKSNFT